MYLSVWEMDLKKLQSKRLNSLSLLETSWDGMTALQKDESIVIKPTDRRGMIVILDPKDYVSKVERKV